jgi:hypothetical protein
MIKITNFSFFYTLTSFFILSTCSSILFYNFYIPIDRWGIESVSYFIHVLNLVDGKSSAISFLTDDTAHYPWEFPSTVYTHQPNGHRFIGAILYVLGAKTIFIHLVLSITISICLTSYFISDYFKKNLLFIIFASVFLAIDFYSAIPLNNGFRTWHFPLFFGCILVISKKINSKNIFLLFLLLGLYEISFAIYVVMACILMILFQNEPIKNKYKKIKFLLIGLSTAFSLFILQLIHYYGLQGFYTDLTKTFISRSGDAQCNLYSLTSRFSYEDLVRNFYGNRVENDFMLRVPCTLGEYIQSIGASIQTSYGIICTTLSLLGLIISFIFIIKNNHKNILTLNIAKINVALFLSFLFSLYIFKAGVLFIYIIIQYPMYNFIVLFSLIFILSLIYSVTKKIIFPIMFGVFVIASLGVNSYSLYSKYPLLNSWKISKYPYESLNSNLPAPWNWIVFGTIGILPNSVPEESPVICIDWKWLPPCSGLGPQPVRKLD